MQSYCRKVFALVFLSVFEAALGAQEISLEVLSDVLAPCGWVHRPSCWLEHVDGTVEPQAGSLLWLDGRAYVLQWMGPGYYLESGAIFEPWGEIMPGLEGQRWMEVYPVAGTIHVSLSWQDEDRNQALSVSDTLVLGSGRAVRIQDVRLRLRVKPVEP